MIIELIVGGTFVIGGIAMTILLGIIPHLFITKDESDSKFVNNIWAIIWGIIIWVIIAISYKTGRLLLR